MQKYLSVLLLCLTMTVVGCNDDEDGGGAATQASGGSSSSGDGDSGDDGNNGPSCDPAEASANGGENVKAMMKGDDDGGDDTDKKEKTAITAQLTENGEVIEISDADDVQVNIVDGDLLLAHTVELADDKTLIITVLQEQVYAKMMEVRVSYKDMDGESQVQMMDECGVVLDETSVKVEMESDSDDTPDHLVQAAEQLKN